MEDAVERADDGLPAYRRAVAGEMKGLGPGGRCPGGPAYAHHAHRLRGGAAGGPGDAGHRHRHVGQAARECARGHLAHGGLAHRAVLGQGQFRHPEHVHLGCVRVGDEAAVEPGRAAADRGDRLGDPAAGAGFCARQSPVSCGQGFANAPGEGVEFGVGHGSGTEQGDEDGEHEQGVAGGDDVVEHHAETALEAAVRPAHRGRLDDVEEAEQRHRDRLPDQRGGREHQHQPGCDHLVPHDAAVVGNAECPPGAVGRQHAGDEQAGEQGEEDELGQRRADQRIQRPGQQRAHRARRPRRQAGSEAQGDEVGGVTHHQACGGAHGRVSCRDEGRIQAGAAQPK